MSSLAMRLAETVGGGGKVERGRGGGRGERQEEEAKEEKIEREATVAFGSLGRKKCETPTNPSNGPC